MLTAKKGWGILPPFTYGPLDIYLDLLPTARLPPVHKRDAQQKFLQHKGAHAEFENPSQAILRAKKQPRAKNKPQRFPANPLATPPQAPEPPRKKQLTAQNPLKISPPEVPQSPHGEGPLGDLLWIDPFFDSRLFFVS